MFILPRQSCKFLWHKSTALQRNSWRKVIQEYGGNATFGPPKSGVLFESGLQIIESYAKSGSSTVYRKNQGERKNTRHHQNIKHNHAGLYWILVGYGWLTETPNVKYQVWPTFIASELVIIFEASGFCYVSLRVARVTACQKTWSLARHWRQRSSLRCCPHDSFWNYLFNIARCCIETPKQVQNTMCECIECNWMYVLHVCFISASLRLVVQHVVGNV